MKLKVSIKDERLSKPVKISRIFESKSPFDFEIPHTKVANIAGISGLFPEEVIFHKSGEVTVFANHVQYQQRRTERPSKALKPLVKGKPFEVLPEALHGLLRAS